jgi:hypothetical protein
MHVSVQAKCVSKKGAIPNIYDYIRRNFVQNLGAVDPEPCKYRRYVINPQVRSSPRSRPLRTQPYRCIFRN